MLWCTSVTWSWRHLVDSTVHSPSERGRHHRSCRLCDRSWLFRSWWHHCRDSAARWGNPRMPAPSASNQMALRSDLMLHGERENTFSTCFHVLLRILKKSVHNQFACHLSEQNRIQFNSIFVSIVLLQYSFYSSAFV